MLVLCTCIQWSWEGEGEELDVIGEVELEGGDTSANCTANCIQDTYILLSLLTAPDMTTLVTLEVHSPGGNDSVSLVPVRNWKIKLQKTKYNSNQNNAPPGSPAYSISK